VHLNTLQVKWGQDLIDEVHLWTGTDYARAQGTAARLDRLCSADLPGPGALFNPATARGFDGRIFFSGEEAGSEGRAFAHIVTGPEKGRSYQLPAFGRMSYENIVPHPASGDRTIAINLDDSTPGQVYVYVGDKQSTGSPIDRAGLTNGALYGIRVDNGGSNYANGKVLRENNGAISGTFVLTDLTDVASGTGATLNSTSITREITDFARPEDGAWDTQDPRVFYFVTTGATLNGQSQRARLYKLTFDSLQAPTGGTIDLVVDAGSLVGTDLQIARSFDNLTVDGDGAVLVQEDPGGSSYIAKTWRIDPDNPLAAAQIVESDRTRFISGAPLFLTTDEESSGIIEVTDLVKPALWYQPGRRYFLADMQAHYSLPGDLVQGGQLYLLASPAPSTD
jgi:hypothetical protein